MKIILALIFSSITVMFDGCVFGQAPALPAELGPHTWTASIKVIDEAGNPIAGAAVSVQYNVPTEPNSDQPTYGEVKGMTDTNGVFKASHKDSSPGIGIIAGQLGYYPTHWGHEFFYDEKRRNPSFTLTLRKIGNPIAMYAKKEETKLQQEDKPMGFDLEAGDWVTPFGKGFHPDLFFTVSRKITGARQYDCALITTFPNNGDGIAIAPTESNVGSEFKTSRTAAEAGYESKLDLHYSSAGSPAEVFGYFIRVRTELNPDGTVKSALYGKIPGGFRFYPGTKAPSAGMGFDYYLNPTQNDRNLEFNPAKNLMRDIGEFEVIKGP